MIYQVSNTSYSFTSCLLTSSQPGLPPYVGLPPPPHVSTPVTPGDEFQSHVLRLMCERITLREGNSLLYSLTPATPHVMTRFFTPHASRLYASRLPPLSINTPYK